MREEKTNKQELPNQIADHLLVLDKKQKKIKVVKSLDEKGNMKTIPASSHNQNQFLRIDKQGDFISNFFSNFFRQLKNPTNFSFFKIPEPLALDKAKELQQQVNSPTIEGAKMMKAYEVFSNTPDNNKLKNTNDMATTPTTATNEYRYQPEQIDWDTMKNIGVSKEYLEKRNLFEPLLRGYKTNELLPISIHLGGTVLRTDARLSLQQSENGNVNVAIHGIKKEPNLHLDFFGHKFTDTDKKNLRETGNMGRVVELINPKNGDTIPSILSIDKLTNDIVALRTEYIKIPNEIKGITLSDVQKQTLMEGKPLQLEGMISTKGTEFAATVQYNADKRYVEFLFDRSHNNKQSIIQNDTQAQTPEAPKTFRGKDLTDEQYKDFNAGKTIYIAGLVDKKGQTYNGYITFNKDTGKTGFEFPGSYKESAKPTEVHKTQTEVNSQGKTNEATKNSKEALKSGQQEPLHQQQKEKQQQPVQQQKQKTPTKSKSRKVS